MGEVWNHQEERGVGHLFHEYEEVDGVDYVAELWEDHEHIVEGVWECILA